VEGGRVVFGDVEEDAGVARFSERGEASLDEAAGVAFAAPGRIGGDRQELGVAGGRLEEDEGDQRAGGLRAEGKDGGLCDQVRDGGRAPRIGKALRVQRGGGGGICWGEGALQKVHRTIRTGGVDRRALPLLVRLPFASAQEPTMSKPAPTLGLDFGTTNSVAALAGPGGQAEAITFSHEDATFAACRSVLCFWKDEDGPGSRVMMEIGPWAIDQFLELGGDCRFIQSFKTFAASPLFISTTIQNKAWRFEDLLSAYLRRLSERAGTPWPKQVVMGRPVQFAGAQPDEKLAQERYETALKRLGFETIHHVYEPVAAAFFYAQRLTEPATILVADFGGGTSDFSIIRFDPGGGKLRAAALSHAGIGIAGDAFDQKIIDHVVSPLFGKGSTFRSGDKTLPIPLSFYSRFAQWNQLSIMRHTKDYADLFKLARQADEPKLLNAFLAFLDADASYLLYRAVAQAKTQLSRAAEAQFQLEAGSLKLNRTITRAEFDGWIGEDVRAIQATVSEALRKADLSEAKIDRVFLTGGTSYVPALRESFDARFGAAKVETGDQFVSIANGLALIAQEENIEPWLARGG